MAALVAEKNEFELKQMGTTVKKAVPDNPKAKLMYYFSCICTCVEPDDDPNICRMTDYTNYYRLDQEDTIKLLILCAAFNPDTLKGVIILVGDDEDLDGCDNQFYEFTQVDTRMVITETVAIGGQRKRVHKIMLYKKRWIEEYLFEPFRLLGEGSDQRPALAMPAPQSKAVTRYSPHPQSGASPSSPVKQQIMSTPASQQPQIQTIAPTPAPVATLPQSSVAMPASDTPPAAVQQPRQQRSTTVPDNPRAKLMYYFKCICLCVDSYNHSETTTRLQDYHNYSSLSGYELSQLQNHCLAPSEVVGKVFFLHEGLKEFQNEFNAVHTIKRELPIPNSIFVAGKERKVKNIMLFKKQWMTTYYFKPVRILTPHGNFSCCKIL